MSSPRTIIAYQATTITNERLLGEAAKAGHLVSLESDNKYYLQGTAKVLAHMSILREDDLQGKGVDDAYAASDLARVATLRSGDRFYARLAAAATVKVGGLLESASGGQFKAYTDGVALVRALEAITSATADDFCLVEVL